MLKSENTSSSLAASLSYWSWWLRGSGSGPGYKRIVNRWLFWHLVIGAIIYFIVPLNLAKASNAVLLPLAGIFVGLTFAWAGNAQALLRASETEVLAQHHPGGFVEYAYAFQTAVLVILVTLVAWGLAGLGVFDRPSPVPWGHRLYPVVATVLYGLASLALRECWHVVLASQLLLVVGYQIRTITKKSRDKD